MANFGIPRRSLSEALSGKRNPLWKGKSHCIECGNALSALRYTRCQPCENKSRSTPFPICIECGKTLSHRRGIRCRTCENGSRRKPQNPQHYVMVWAPKHPNSDVNGYISEHRLAMAEWLGRPLVDGEVVHHKDEDKTNNDISNLSIFPNIGDHQWFHKKGVRVEMTGDALCC